MLPGDEPARDRWEYQVAVFREEEIDRSGRLTATLNEMGSAGWELVSSVIRDRQCDIKEVVCFLKRRREE